MRRVPIIVEERAAILFEPLVQNTESEIGSQQIGTSEHGSIIIHQFHDLTGAGPNRDSLVNHRT
jgi:hypothetical protein